MILNPQFQTKDSTGSQPTRPEYVPGVLQIKIKNDVVNEVPDLLGATPASIRALRLPSMVDEPFAALRQKRAIRKIVPVFSRKTGGQAFSMAPTSVAAAFTMSVRNSENEDLQGINILHLSKDANLEQAEKDLRKTAGIEYVHRIPARWACATKTTKKSSDPFVNRQWGLRAINYFQAVPVPDAGAVKVAVLDTGMDTTHPDLQNFSTYHHDGASATDIVGHGTHVAGIIAATAGNKIGITGICHCELRMWKIFGDEEAADGEYYVDEVMYQRALNGARNSGVRALNLSIGGTVFTQTESLLIRRLIDSGCTVVAAMGNEYTEGNPVEYPAAYPGVVAVGAISETNLRAYFSNTGPHIALTAPGDNILSTLPMKKSSHRDQTKYASWSGTSMATPHVTAAAALIQAKNPGLDPKQVAKLLKRTATKLPAMKNKSKTKDFGAGLLNLQTALK